MVEEPLIRVMVIADYYRWHFMTDDPEIFKDCLISYWHTLTSSQKENTYHIMNIFMTRPDYEICLKNFKSSSQKPKTNLKLVDDN